MATAETKTVTSDRPGPSPTVARVVLRRSPLPLLGVFKRFFSTMGRALIKSRVPEMSPELRKAISRFVRDECFEDWLRLPNKMLGGKSPEELLKRGQDDLIWKAIDEAQHGEGS